MSKIHFIYGPQGAGKSTYSIKLAAEEKGVHMSIDDWMWKMYGDDMPKSLNLKWIMERVERCEQQIWELTKRLANCGCEVILDLGFTKRDKRKSLIQLAEELGLETQVHYIRAPHAIRRNRVLQRNVDKGDTFSFEVTPGMFDFMEGEYQAPSDSELVNAIILE